MNEDITIASGYVPGVIGRVAELHGTYYSQHWNLGVYFEARVATEIAELMSRFDPAHDGLWVASAGERIVGAVFIDGKDIETEGGRLRWFIIDPAYQGRGIGHRLMQAATRFCDAQGFKRTYLTTFAGLAAARHLYERYGFRLCGEMDATELTGDPSKVEQILERFLPER